MCIFVVVCVVLVCLFAAGCLLVCLFIVWVLFVGVVVCVVVLLGSLMFFCSVCLVRGSC